MTPEHDNEMMQTGRQFLGRTSAGIGSVALASLLNPRLFAGLASFPNFAPKAKRVIFIFQSYLSYTSDITEYLMRIDIVDLRAIQNTHVPLSPL